MNRAGKKIRLAIFLNVSIGIVFIVAAAIVVIAVNSSMHRQALLEAQLKARLILDRNLAIHTYFSHILKPSIFAWSEPFRKKEYFDPAWMSSTYALREIEKFFKSINPSGYSFKDAALNARSPENEADEYERAFLEKLRVDKKLESESMIRQIGGKPYLVVLRKGEVLEASCLRCHSTPQEAPKGLTDSYGSERSFHRQTGDVISAVSLRIPLSEAYREANIFSLKLSVLLLTGLICLFTIQYWVYRRYLLKPLNVIQEKALQIATHEEHLGQQIPQFFGRELNELSTAFNELSVKLRLDRDHLEETVDNRTKALQESEERVRAKLNAILLPEGDIGKLDLADILDVPAIQSMMDNFYSLTNIGVAILDFKGQVLVATGWQDVCTKFHRIHPESCKYCVESDTVLSRDVEPGTFKIYRCKNKMWDIVTPLIVGGSHVGNIFLGQFFFADERPNYDSFRAQARQYGFDEKEYIAALERVPRWSREKVDTVMTFYSRFAHLLSTLSYSNIKLARLLKDRDNWINSLQESEKKFKTMVETIPLSIYYSVGIEQKCEYLNPMFTKSFGYTLEDIPTVTQWLPLAYPDENYRKQISEEWTARVKRAIETKSAIAPMEVVITCKDGSKKNISWGYISLGEKNYAYGIDLTERKLAEEKIKASLLEKETMLKEIHHRVKNNLAVISSLLGLQSRYLEDEKSREIFQKSQDRVRVMANIHTLLYQSEDLSSVDFGGFIRDLAGHLQQSCGTTKFPIEIHVDIADVSLPIETSIPCGLVLNELVSNALKHAFPEELFKVQSSKFEVREPGTITITLREQDQENLDLTPGVILHTKDSEPRTLNVEHRTLGKQVVLTVQDNGIGFPEAVNFQNTQTLGLELVNLLVGQINGIIDLTVDGGTKFTITFPMTNHKG